MKSIVYSVYLKNIIDEAVEATCTEAGKTEGKHCAVCKEVLTKQEEIKATGHTEVVDEAVPATCTEGGKSEGKHCAVCKEVLKAQEEIEAPGHTEVVDEAVEATCTEAGKTEGKHCAVCKEVLIKQQKIVATGHKYVDEKCTACGNIEKLSAVVVPSVTNTTTGIQIKWKKAKYATGYLVYRKSGTGKYTVIATIKNANTLTYTDKTASSGTTYTYVVRATNGSLKSSYKAVSILRLANPSVKAANIVGGVRIQWNKVKGASGYAIYRKSGNGAYKKLTSVKNANTLTYTDKAAVSGTTYTYTVRAVNGSLKSSYTGVKLLYLANPVISVKNVKKTVEVSWKGIKGATGYVVYRKIGSGSYVKVATVNSKTLKYKDTKVKAGKTYTYTVRAVNGKIRSSYKGKSIKMK